MSDRTALPKRPGRRPSQKPRNIRVSVSLPPTLHEALRRLGGTTWVQQKIIEAMKKNPDLCWTPLSAKSHQYEDLTRISSCPCGSS